jgi:multiple sugar transport system permease protein
MDSRISAKLRKPFEKITSSLVETEARVAANAAKSALASLFRLIVILGVSYVILGPLIGILASSFFSDSDAYSPLVYIIPQQPTLERYTHAILRLDFFNVIAKDLWYVLAITAIQVLVCSFVGYGFARFDFPFKRALFGCVIVMIVIPAHSVMLPLYIAFRKFDPLGLMTLLAGGPKNLLGTPVPVAIMSLLGCGLRSGVFIYIFNQFFRGLPKEIEEAAFVDGAGPFYTYLRIMLVNAAPSVLTVAIFSLVWQYNDTFMANLFHLSSDMILSKRITSLQATLANVDRILDPGISQLYVYAGIVMMLMPIIIIYAVLQRRFIEGVERSGIVG